MQVFLFFSWYWCQKEKLTLLILVSVFIISCFIVVVVVDGMFSEIFLYDQPKKKNQMIMDNGTWTFVPNFKLQSTLNRLHRWVRDSTEKELFDHFYNNDDIDKWQALPERKKNSEPFD